MHGNRGIYHEGWTAVTKHRTPWTVGQIELPSFDQDVWELYDTTTDWTQAYDVAGQHPERLAALQQLFLSEAEKYHVLPLDDRFLERLVPELSGRKLAPASMTLRAGATRLHEDVVPNVKNKSFSVTAQLVADSDTSSGVLIAQGGQFGGWAIFLDDGQLTYVHNYLGIERTHIRSQARVERGAHQVQVLFGYDGGGLGKGGDITLLIDQEIAGRGRLERTVPFSFSLIEGLDVGYDWGTPVSDRYSRGDGFHYSGEIAGVTIATGDDAVEPTRAEELRSVLTSH